MFRLAKITYFSNSSHFYAYNPSCQDIITFTITITGPVNQRGICTNYTTFGVAVACFFFKIARSGFEFRYFLLLDWYPAIYPYPEWLKYMDS